LQLRLEVEVGPLEREVAPHVEEVAGHLDVIEAGGGAPEPEPLEGQLEAIVRRPAEVQPQVVLVKADPVAHLAPRRVEAVAQLQPGAELPRAIDGRDPPGQRCLENGAGVAEAQEAHLRALVQIAEVALVAAIGGDHRRRRAVGELEPAPHPAIEAEAGQELELFAARAGADVQIVPQGAAGLGAGSGSQRRPHQVLAGDHVDHAQEGVGAVENRGGAPHDLDVIDGAHRHQLRAQPVARGQAERDGVPVEHHLDGAALAPQPGGDPPHPGVGDDEVVDDVEAQRLLQHLGDGAVAPAGDVLGGDHGDHRRHVLDAGGGLGGGGDLQVDAQQRRQVHPARRRRGGRLGGRRRLGQGRRQHQQGKAHSSSPRCAR
jgi:hypothetical protein